jgi:hypothetical protein
MEESRCSCDASGLRHVLSLSGGKDSTALAIYLRDKVPSMEYVFMDTGEELPETHDYLEKLESFLGKPIVRLNPDRPFQHYLEIYRGVLPDPRTRWCTRMLKIKPFERYIGEDLTISYIAIRADEQHRKGYISTKPNITPKYPFIEAGIKKEDVMRILEESGLGLPAYYKWRSRSGCYFCFFQRRIEWVGLLNNHPDLYEKAKSFEKFDPETGERFTWNQCESLDELAQPERIAAIRRAAEQQEQLRLTRRKSLIDILSEDEDEEDENAACLICHL